MRGERERKDERGENEMGDGDWWHGRRGINKRKKGKKKNKKKISGYDKMGYVSIFDWPI